MAKLIWTDQALHDLIAIGDYIAENSATYARLTVQKLYQKPIILKKFPLSGRIVPEKNEINLREIIEGNYRIIYEIAPDKTVYILTVYHSARALKA